ncbi:hypothetical protein [Alkalicoccobacillus plakortidis]|uniref:Uncharacterized protein n=1 Tax=Alkalicoccobacillus plakortidis TaxID=444060 RepID=A0ABT0XJH0_9BACI|nr:hypothetical protein [Alkalicoccobacillus plakortidis]MCM2675508.1 hypothetical protein [Alkalicoccobacillus plakortidis]
MKTKLIYNLDDGKNEIKKIVEFEREIFIPEKDDVFLVNGWGYIVSTREFEYKDEILEINVYCYRESKPRG